MAGRAPLVGKNLADSLKLLEDTAIILNQYHIPYILDGGTLLGVVREQRLLPWDTDMDMSVNESSIGMLKRAIWRLRFKGYRVVIRRFRLDANPFQKGDVRVVKIRNYVAPFVKGNAVLDIFIRRISGTMQVWAVGEKNTVFPQAPTDFFEKTKMIEFNYFKYSVPKDVEDFLTYRYGDWQTPVKRWNSMKDDLAIPKG